MLSREVREYREQHVAAAEIMHPAPKRYRVEGEAPMDDEKYPLGESNDLAEAQGLADAYVAQDPRGFTADVYDMNDENRSVYHAGTL